MSHVAEPAPLDAGAWLRRLRGPAVFVLIGLALVVVLAALGRAPNSAPLDPRNPAPDGTRALAALLADRGDAVSTADRVRDLSGDATNTVVISMPRAVSGDALQEVAAGRSNVVVLEPDDRALAALGVSASFDALAPDGDTIEPGCGLPAATVAGRVRISGLLYRVTSTAPGVTACYDAQGDASILAVTRPSGGRTVVIGSAATLTNAHLADEGDAALSLGLLDNPTVQWAPGPLEAAATSGAGSASGSGSPQGLLNLLPSRILWATLQAFLAVVLLALWRARRLGPVISEPLPVVVRAAETVEGSGRLLHAARARTGAAAALRSAAIARLVRTLRIADSDAHAVTPIVAERSGRPAPAIDALLYGGDPGDDAALARLGRELSSLESYIRRDMHPGGQR